MPDTFRLPTLFRILLVMLTTVSLLSAAPTMADDAMSESPLTLTGSTSLANLVSLWVEAFRLRYPTASFSVADSGSAVGLEALLNGSANAVLLSTPLRKYQRQRFVDRYGYAPTVVPVAHDGVAIFVNTLNPLTQISLPQLDAIFSRTRRCGANKPVHTWGDLGLKNDFARPPVAAVGLSTDSGAYYLFRSKVLCGGDFRPDFQSMAGPDAVQAIISHNRAAIGFISSSQTDPSLHTVAVARLNGGTAISPTPDTIRSGRYPLARTLSIAYNLPPEHNMPPLLRGFLDFVLSKDGQDIAAEAGYVKLAGTL